jgi:nucleotide-binding universal stress UspA family protein/hemerythrin-like domain-containing protein
MYRHLLVPLDDSALSVGTVSQAVEFARALGAKVTFMHAKADYGATSIGALERVLAPAAFNEGMAGGARGLLAKAEVGAQVAGVACDCVVVASDRPYQAILDTARSRDCDLIYMASHGNRGIRSLVLGSQTQKVLQNATIPVLVSSVQSNVLAAAVVAPLTTIIDEHRSIAAVIRGLERLMTTIREQREPPPFPLLKAIVHYIKAFPEALHHPKEDAYLFPRLRLRTKEFDESLAELERQHEEGHAIFAELERTLGAYEANPAAGFDAFAAAVERYSTTQWWHMNLERKVILPAAQKYLTAEDWAEIADAFGENGDPRFSAENDDEFRQLFSRILNLAPGPVTAVTPGAR